MRNLNITIFGNTNNYPLLLAEGLKAIGHNVKLIINNKELLHRPESKYKHFKNNYPSWIYDFSHIDFRDIVHKKPIINPVIDLLTSKNDLVILNDFGLAFIDELNCPHIAFLTGSDLSYYCNYSSIDCITQCWPADFKRSIDGQREIRATIDFFSRQREAVARATVVCYMQKGLIPESDRLLESIGVIDDQRLMLYISDTLSLKESTYKNDRFIIVSGSRVVYKKDKNQYMDDLDFKGTDILLNGFNKYKKSGGRGILYLPEKGDDVNYAKEEIKKMGISDYVVWYPNLPLYKFRKLLNKASIVCDQFGKSVPGMVTLDAYALGKPVLANLRNDILKNVFGKSIPGFSSTSSEQISKQLITLEKNSKSMVTMGEYARKYAQMYLSPEVMSNKLLNKFIENIDKIN